MIKFSDLKNRKYTKKILIAGSIIILLFLLCIFRCSCKTESRKSGMDVSSSKNPDDKISSEKKSSGADNLYGSEAFADSEGLSGAENGLDAGMDDGAEKGTDELLNGADNGSEKLFAEGKTSSDKKTSGGEKTTASGKKSSKDDKSSKDKTEESKKSKSDKKSEDIKNESAGEEKTLTADASGEDSENQKKLDELYSLMEAYENLESSEEKNKNLERSLELAKSILEKDPENDAAHFILAQEALNKKDYETAKNELEFAIARNRNNYLYFYDLGKISYITKDFNKAADFFLTSCGLNELFAQSRYNLGLSYNKLSKFNEARSSFEKAVEINPLYKKAYLELARVNEKLGNYEAGAAAYKKVIELESDNVNAIVELASLCHESGNLEESEIYFRQALSKMDKSEIRTLTMYNLSAVLLEQNRLSDAENYALQSYEEKDTLNNNVSKSNIVYNYCFVCERNGKIEKAKQLYSVAIMLNDSHYKAKANLAGLYMQEENCNYEIVLPLLKQSYAQNPKSFEVNYNLGNAYIATEEYESALEYLNNALSLSPENTDCKMAMALANTKLGNYEESKSIYESIILKDSDYLDAYVDYSKMLMQSKESKEALKNLLIVKQKNPEYRKAEIDSLIAVLQY